ncbi:MAG TPA: hypothetical protein VEL75_15920 [Candidatus Methylomirabilis sp.]|nr:hypothetical protein [Candidatus Methylomirabilis sp.]
MLKAMPSTLRVEDDVRDCRLASGDAARFEHREAFADVDCGPQLTIDAIDPGVEPPDLREQLAFERDRFGPERIDPGHEAVIQAVDLLIETADLRRETRVDPVELRREASIELIELRREASIDLVDLHREAGVQAIDLHREAGVQPVDLLVEQTDVAADRVELGGNEILERLLDLIVDAHPLIGADVAGWRQRLGRDTA